jgi:hypothetical protein
MVQQSSQTWFRNRGCIHLHSFKRACMLYSNLKIVNFMCAHVVQVKRPEQAALCSTAVSG